MMSLGAKYCYWSVARGPADRARMENCVRSARHAGVFKEFHVLTDAPIDGCECYDALELEDRQDLYKLIYLKAAVSKLSFDHFVWIDPGSEFVNNPSNLLGALSRSPIHVPLEIEVAKIDPALDISGITAGQYRSAMIQCGVLNPVYLSGSAFWMVARDAIDVVCDLATEGWRAARSRGTSVDGSFALGYAMQMLCGDPAKHTIAARPDLWAADYSGFFGDREPSTEPWQFADSTGTEQQWVQPSIVTLRKRCADFAPRKQAPA